MTQTNLQQLKEQLDELTTRFNQLLDVLSEVELKKKIDFSEFEISDEYDDDDDLEEDIKKEYPKELLSQIPRPPKSNEDDQEVIDDDDNLLN